MERAARVGGARGAVTAVGQSRVEGPRGARRWGRQKGRVLWMERVEVGSR